jgi:hypothetical protein
MLAGLEVVEEPDAYARFNGSFDRVYFLSELYLDLFSP